MARRRRLRIPLLVGVGLVVALPRVAAAQWIELEGRYWRPDVSARAKIEGGDLPGTAFDFGKDLGIDAEPLADLRLSVFTGPNSKLRLAYTHADFEGDTILGRTIQFNGTDYPAMTRVVSELDVHYFRLGWIWQVPVIAGILKVGPVLEAKGAIVEATLKAPAATPPLRETETVAIAIPTVGVAIDVSPHRVVDLFAEVSGLTLGDRGHVVDAEAGVRVTLIKFLAITGGYRFLEVRGEEARSFAKLRLSGPFVGATFRF